MTDFLDSLGRTTDIAEMLQTTPNAVSNWRQRGIPWKKRPAIAALAAQRGIDLPADFWAENAQC